MPKYSSEHTVPEHLDAKQRRKHLARLYESKRKAKRTPRGTKFHDSVKELVGKERRVALQRLYASETKKKKNKAPTTQALTDINQDSADDVDEEEEAEQSVKQEAVAS
jgi:transcription termination factor NusB